MQTAPLPEQQPPAAPTTIVAGNQPPPAPVPANSPPALRPASLAAPGPMPRQIHGYRLIKELGRGLVGTVYLARQPVVGRQMAFKIVKPDLAKDSQLMARLARDAYAASQLRHPNLLVVEDLGVDGERHYLCAEFVRGETLRDLLIAQGKLDLRVATSHILQAARGIDYAHRHGLTHGNVNPGNVLVDSCGLIKVADLGLASALPPTALVNAPANAAACVAPEQCETGAVVDHRADIYSLGCTWYWLMAGRPPVEGASTAEINAKRRLEQVIRPDQLIEGMPRELADINLKMLAPRPEDRYASLKEVIRDLEGCLGVSAGKECSACQEHATLIEQSVAAYNAPPIAAWRLPIVAGFFGLCGLLFLLGGILLGSLWLAASIFSLAALTATIYFVYSGWIERTYLFDRFLELLALAQWKNWTNWAAGGLVLVLLLFAFGSLCSWLGLAIIAAGCALGYYYLVDRRLAAERAQPLKTLRELLQYLRLRGVAEAAIEQFVVEHSGERWEELFEALFGYEARFEAQELYRQGEPGRLRLGYRPWREPVIRWINDRVRQAREEKIRKYLQHVEEQSLAAQGLEPMQARRQGERVAEALVAGAAPPPEQPADQAPADPGEAVRHKREWVKQMLAEARAGEYARQKEKERERALAPLHFLLGPQFRFLLGCLLLAGFALWAIQNNAVQVDAQALSNLPNAQDLSEVQNPVTFDASKTGTSPLSVPVVGRLFDSFNPGIAGAMLVFLGLFRGWKMSLYAMPAAAIIVLGPAIGMPGIPLLGSGYLTSAILGLTIGFLGILYGQTFEDNWRVE